jgi:hypothetical protein
MKHKYMLCFYFVMEVFFIYCIKTKCAMKTYLLEEKGLHLTEGTGNTLTHHEL